MASKLPVLHIGYFLLFFSSCFCASARQLHLNPNSSSSSFSLSGGFDAHPTPDCSSPKPEIGEDNKFKVKKPPFVLPVKTLFSGKETKLADSKARDLTRIRNLSTRIAAAPDSYSGQLMATLESGVSLGSGEYLMDVFIGTPPKHFSLILDTGSDLNWIQCAPCHDCFEQTGPYYDPRDSSSYREISCKDLRCRLVSSPDPRQPCESENQSCPYFYWYGDSSNTTGDLALEKFTVNLTTSTGNPYFRKVENIMFGCGHWNRGLFHGAAGLLGLGRGPLSFASQIQSLFGHQTFSYCLVDRNSDSSVSSRLIFGENNEHPELNFTALLSGNENPEETWDLSASGGTIIDSGTTLSYFADPAYKKIKEAFRRKMERYTLVEDFPLLESCYNVSGVENLELPSMGIRFRDGAEWNFPAENYFIKVEPEDVMCLAILGAPRSGLSIIGNYQQQNFHVMYDTKNSRLGFAATNCADHAQVDGGADCKLATKFGTCGLIISRL